MGVRDRYVARRVVGGMMGMSGHSMRGPKGAGVVGRSSGAVRSAFGRRGVRYGVGGAAGLGGMYAYGRSSGANRNSLVPPSTGIHGI